jgi:hypothetical protein
MLPLELIVEYIAKHWQCRGALRMQSNDCQICGYEYCAEGAIADVFIKHAPNEVATIKARWDDQAFVWEENGVEKKELLFLPIPVIRWIDSWHGPGTGEKLRVSLAFINDRGCPYWSLEQVADLIKIQFGLGDPLAVAKVKGTKAYASLIKHGMEQGVTHGH